MSDFRVVDFVGLGTVTGLQPFGDNTLKISGKSLADSSVVRINGNTIPVGEPSVISYDGMRFGVRARVFESCKGYVLACFGAY